MKATHKIKDQIEQKARLDRNRDINLNEVKKIDQRIQKNNVEISEYSNKINTAEKENPWIIAEKHLFNTDKTDVYNFTTDGFSIKD
jgi:chromosome segregation ATPase